MCLFNGRRTLVQTVYLGHTVVSVLIVLGHRPVQSGFFTEPVKLCVEGHKKSRDIRDHACPSTRDVEKVCVCV